MPWKHLLAALLLPLRLPLVQGPVEFLDEPGEFALLPATGLLSYWPHDPATLAPGSSTPVVVATSPTAIEFRGKGWLEFGLVT